MASDVGTVVPDFVAPPRPVGDELAAAVQQDAPVRTPGSGCGWTAGMYAAFSGKLEQLEELDDDALTPDKTKLRPIHLAAMRGHCKCIELLLKRQPEVIEATEVHGRTPLMFAATGGSAAAIELLLEKGAAIDARSRDGKTALHWATVAHRLDAINALVAAGASDEVRQEEREPLIPGKAEPGATPFDLANGRNDRDPVLRHVLKYFKDVREARASGEMPPTLPEPEWIVHAKAFVERTTAEAEAGGAAAEADKAGATQASAAAGSMWDDEEEQSTPDVAPPIADLKIADSHFEAASAFSGRRPGCVFKLGAHGLGYYADAAAVGSAVVPTSTPAAGGVPKDGMSKISDRELKEMLELARAAKDEPGELDDLD
eukprot:scaffold92347_cov36-Tisochrysis_lutea.AAC.1